MALTESPGIALNGVDGHIDVYVKYDGSTLSLYKTVAGVASQAWGPDPDFDIPKHKVYAIYFRRTANCQTGTTFPLDPFDWGPAGKPATVILEKILTNHTAFSIKVDNSAPPKHDARHDFDLEVDTPNRGIVCMRISEIDPTIVEKGEEGEGGAVS